MPSFPPLNKYLQRIDRKTPEYLIDLYGYKDWDARAYVYDPYFIGCTDDEEYLFIWDTKDGKIKIFKGFTSELLREIQATTIKGAGCIDCQPDSHVLLYNNGSAVTEHNIDTNVTTQLFAKGNDWAPMYKRQNWDHIVLGQSGTKNIEVRDRLGNLIESRTLAVNQKFGTSILYANGVVASAKEGTFDGFKMYGSGASPSVLGNLHGGGVDHWMPTHQHTRGALSTMGFELTYGLLLEDANMLMSMFPISSNVWWITKNYNFIGTYHFSLLRFNFKGLREAPKEPRLLWQTKTVGASQDGELRFICGEHCKATCIISSSQTGDAYLGIPIVYKNGLYSTIFQTTGDPSALDYAKVTSVKNYSVQIDSIPWGILHFFNTSGSPATVHLLVYTEGI